ncbi:hypothetical protein N7462_000039 [Penicillium macrosclerotiorum]|uniref:uncharacterized protein n=1 Tax=Penicillium macrosclerotiorum TaxID=303699 RepID=UPI00254901C4|nr:uncharacterized protein N7462_000039 [Penicillium macrosclerotiorum]KAJ5698034.1 hypothetical protein N7462_000039 [Penicillium macrosclerotiorum]
MDGFKPALYALKILSLAGLVQSSESFPAPFADAHAELKVDDGVTFDPLGVAAILYNPRADRSTARLYTQYDRSLFTWPHMTMIGGTLPPMQMLVERLTAPFKWIHPAIKMCTKDTTMLPIRSDQYLAERHNLFEPSSHPGNDFAIVYVDAMHNSTKKPGDPASNDEHEFIRSHIGSIRWRAGKWTLNLLCLINGLSVVAGMIFGILVADIWAFTLFLLYSCHWGASVGISLTPMVTEHIPARIDPNSNDRFAVYEREEGGTVIFKGAQSTLETWARSTWEYNPTRGKDSLHWLWIITGTLSAIASVACMVNMHGSMQLAFLGILVFATVAEIGATRIARILQTKARGPIPKAFVRGNSTRSMAIIRATVGVDQKCRLTGLDWISMGLLPDMPVFQEMQVLLKDIGEIDGDRKGEMPPLVGDSRDAAIQSKCSEFLRSVDDKDHNRLGLGKRILKEVYETLKLDYELLPEL